MSKIIITESQIFRILYEQSIERTNYNFSEGGEDDELDQGYQQNVHWFDYRSPELQAMNIPEDILMLMFKNNINFFKSKYDLKRVFVTDQNRLVAFLIFSYTTKKKEGVGENENDDKEYPVIISTAVDPKYRNRGLLKRMIERANIQKPYFVHTSPISPHEIWNKLGCEKEYDLSQYGQGNSLSVCK